MSPIFDQWHALPLPDLYQRLESQGKSLTHDEADRRLQQYGFNSLPQRGITPWWVVLLHQFKSPLIYILIVAAIVSLLMQDVKDAVVIALVLLLNATIGFWQESRADKQSQALQKLMQINALVIRDDKQRVILSERLVPGDIVLLESGNRVPADIRLLEATGLKIDESMLTGESLPVHKEVDWLGTEQTSFAERRNLAYAGTIVSHGRARGIVVRTGLSTSVGQLAIDSTASSHGKPPLIVRMERFTRIIAIGVLLAAILIMLVGILVHGQPFSKMLLFAIALIVSAIPEGLPVAITVALAVATSRMARRGVIVRHLTAVESLGSCTYIASDKTGTLTCNALTVQQFRLASGEHAIVTGEGFAPEGNVNCSDNIARSEETQTFMLVCMLCNEASLYRDESGWSWNGDAVDVALLSLVHKWGLSTKDRKDYALLTQIPFEPENQFAATVHQDNLSQVLVSVKGSPEKIFSMCSWADEAERQRQEQAAIAMAAHGFRVLAMAHARLTCMPAAFSTTTMPTLQFLGMAGMIDPLRAGVREAIEQCRSAGIQVAMVTGDHCVTAMAIARELGLATLDDEAITGTDLANLTADEWTSLFTRVHIFARVSPQQKLQIVNYARANGHFVAVTGDGVNDAPALRAANIGVAMGKEGTDVAREAAELILSDDHFATIVSGVEEGRVAYDNIRKVIYLLISTGAAEVILMTLVLFTGSPYLPLLPVQILWLNLVTNGIQDVALAFEPN